MVGVLTLELVGWWGVIRGEKNLGGKERGRVGGWREKGKGKRKKGGRGGSLVG